MAKFRKPTKDEELVAWRDLAFSLNFQRTITGNKPAVEAILQRIDRYVESHDTGNGTKANPEVHQQVWGAFWTHIAVDEPRGLKPREEP